MTAVLLVLVVVLLAACAGGGVILARRHTSANALAPSPERVLFPFLGRTLAKPALDAALRLARADGATLVPAYLAEVPRHLPFDAPLRRQSATALTLLEAIEQRAQGCGVAVDGRIERGRDVRHALRELVSHERYDRVVVAAGGAEGGGFTPAETAWMLATLPGEIVVLRPNGTDPVVPPTATPSA
jgi:Universal stress protein family